MTAIRKVSEKRLEKRWSVDKPGKVYFGAPRDERRCQVLDWSARGAKLELPANFTCPEDVIVKINFGKSIWASAPGKLAWNHNNCVGIQFCEELVFDVETIPSDNN